MGTLAWVTRPEAWLAMASEWNRLLERSVHPLPFLRHEYLAVWWQSLGAGEWSQARLAVAVYRDDEGRLLGAAPFFITPTAHGPTMMLVGSHRLSDYLDVLVVPEAQEAFARALGQALFGPRRAFPEVRRWEGWNLLPDSPLRRFTEGWAEQFGWRRAESPCEEAPILPLPPSWEGYLHLVGKKQRHEIRRKLRRAQRQPEPVRWHRVTQPEELDPAMDRLFALMEHHPPKAAFFTPPRRRWLRQVARTALEHGWLFLAFLYVGERPAAAFLCFDFHQRLWIYNSGFDPEFKHLSPGWVLLAHMIQWAIARGYRAVDFMRGDETYKYRFGAQRRPLYWVLMEAP